jgi:hypothetical protein
MNARINATKVSPGAYTAMFGLAKYLAGSRLDNHVSDQLFEATRKQFSEEELVDLTLAVAAINAWNRLNIAFRTPAGSYQAGQLKKSLAAAS